MDNHGLSLSAGAFSHVARSSRRNRNPEIPFRQTNLSATKGTERINQYVANPRTVVGLEYAQDDVHRSLSVRMALTCLVPLTPRHWKCAVTGCRGGFDLDKKGCGRYSKQPANRIRHVEVVAQIVVSTWGKAVSFSRLRDPAVGPVVDSKHRRKPFMDKSFTNVSDQLGFTLWARTRPAAPAASFAVR